MYIVFEKIYFIPFPIGLYIKLEAILMTPKKTQHFQFEENQPSLSLWPSLLSNGVLVSETARILKYCSMLKNLSCEEGHLKKKKKKRTLFRWSYKENSYNTIISPHMWLLRTTLYFAYNFEYKVRKYCS